MKSSSELYSNFLDQRAADKRVLGHLDRLAELGTAIVRHGFDGILGVSLLHKHFDLAENEEIVGSLRGGFWCSDASSAKLDGLLPMSWKYVGADRVRSWQPIEYFIPSDNLRTKVQSSNSVAAAEDLLGELGQLFYELGVADVFGLTLLDDTTAELTAGNTWFEVSSESHRRMVLCQVPAERAKDFEAATTVWAFVGSTNDSAVERSVVKACAYGSSRCCCGYHREAKEILADLGSPASVLFE